MSPDKLVDVNDPSTWVAKTKVAPVKFTKWFLLINYFSCRKEGKSNIWLWCPGQGWIDFKSGWNRQCSGWRGSRLVERTIGQQNWSLPFKFCRAHWWKGCCTNWDTTQTFRFIVTWENSQHFATPPLVFVQTEVWERSPEIPYWWRVTTQIRCFWLIEVIFLYGATNQKRNPDLGRDMSLIWNFSTHFSDVIL